MKGVRVDPARGTVRVQGGAPGATSTMPAHAFGLAVPSGIISTTGVGGLTLGGGLGHLTRAVGLDHRQPARRPTMVLADGRFVTASADEHPDLFWAMRGGGGNFGVVTSFLFRAHPVDTVIAGPDALADSSSAPEVHALLVPRFIAQAPDELNGLFAFLTVPPGAAFPSELHLKKMCGDRLVLHRPAEKAERAASRRSARLQPALDGVGPMPFPALQSTVRRPLPAGPAVVLEAPTSSTS